MCPGVSRLPDVSLNRVPASPRCNPRCVEGVFFMRSEKYRVTPFTEKNTFRELSSWELEHSRDVENGLPPCLSVCVCVGTRSVTVGKREG